MSANAPASMMPATTSPASQGGGPQGVLESEGTCAAEQPPDDKLLSQPSPDAPCQSAGEPGLSATELKETAAAVLAAQQAMLHDQAGLPSPAVTSTDATRPSTSPFGSSFHSAMAGSLPSVINTGGENAAPFAADDFATDVHASAAASQHSKKLPPERHMWSKEETQALVDGCNAVSSLSACACSPPAT